MTKAEMGSTKRERLLDSALVELGEHGRDALDTDRLASRAGVTVADLVAEFGDLGSCLDAAYEQLTRRLADTVRTGCERAREAASEDPLANWSAGVRGGLEALLRELAASPPRATALIRTYPGLGTTQRARYEALLSDFTPFLTTGRRLAAAAGAELPDEIELLAVGAAEAIVFEAVASGRAAALTEMAPAILFSLLVPFIGAKAATAEMEESGGGR